MKETEYADRLIERYKNLKCPLRGKLMYSMSNCLALQCAIQDVENTIDVLRNINEQIDIKNYDYYQNVLQILKDKL